MLLMLAMLGCMTGFVCLVQGNGSLLFMEGKRPVFTLADKHAGVSLPCKIDGTQLIARELMLYEGPFLEGRTDTPVSEITALLLYNSGKQEIAQAEVILTAQQELTFFASNIMPGAHVLVLEKNAAAWQSWEVTACTGWTSPPQRPSLPEDALQIREVDMGTIALTNTTEETLTDIWIYYKNYLPQSGFYIGGITYLKTVAFIRPGQTVELSLRNYASGYSRIMKAEAIS